MISNSRPANASLTGIVKEGESLPSPRPKRVVHKSPVQLTIKAGITLPAHAHSGDFLYDAWLLRLVVVICRERSVERDQPGLGTGLRRPASGRDGLENAKAENATRRARCEAAPSRMQLRARG